MPLYEYVCRDCGKQFTFLSGVVSGNGEARCPRCASADLSKLMSRFVRGRSDDARMDAMAERLESNDYDDPAALRALAREVGREMTAETGEDMTAELEEMIESEARAAEHEDAGSARASAMNADDGTIY